MGSSSSKTISLQENKFTVGICQCLNDELYGSDQADKFKGKKLKVAVEYGPYSSEMSVPFVKSAIFEKGCFQFTQSPGVNEFHITLGSTGTYQWESKSIAIRAEDENKMLTIELVGSGHTSQSDGATQQTNPNVRLVIFYTKNVGEMGTKTRLQKGQKEVLAYFDEVSVNSLEEGDIVLFSGESTLSALIKNRTYRPYSHVGIIFKTVPRLDSGETPEDDKPELYILESTAGDLNDPFRKHQPLSGVTIFKLEDRIRNYDGHSVQCIKLKQRMTDTQRERFITNIFSLHGARLPFDVIQGGVLLLERLKLWNIGTNHSVFCSELVTIILHRVGLISSQGYSPANTDPGEVSDFACFDRSTCKFLKYDLMKKK